MERVGVHMVPDIATESFRAFFNETTADAETCECAVQDAIENAPGLSLVDDAINTIVTENGDVQNITVDFAVAVGNADDSRSPRGRLLATLMGGGPCDGLTHT